MKNLHKNIGIFAASLLATSSAVYLYSPVIKTHADSSATAEISVTIGEVMSLSLNTNELNLSSNPNNFVSGTINATVSTNSQYGYTLALEDVDGNTNLVHTNENISDAISSSFSGSKTSSEMEANTWGFSLNSTDFFKVPVNGSPVALKRTTTPMATETETTPVDFGVKLGNITSGKYSDSVLFTMYVNGQDGKPTDPTGQTTPANPSEPGYVPTGIVTIAKMQDMTHEICEATQIGESTLMLDDRDYAENYYTVKKLADGKCWMTENLRIHDKRITSDDSNIPEGEEFVIPASTSHGHFNDYNDVSVQVDISDGSYHSGYYSFVAATAGWGKTSVTSGTAPKDICPRGWRLPTGGDNGDFAQLYGVYNTSESMRGEPAYVLSGRAGLAGLERLGDFGRYWSSMPNSTVGATALYITENEVVVQANNGKQNGLSIRCVAK